MTRPSRLLQDIQAFAWGGESGMLYLSIVMPRARQRNRFPRIKWNLMTISRAGELMRNAGLPRHERGIKLTAMGKVREIDLPQEDR
jgi:hypothetical protein